MAHILEELDYQYGLQAWSHATNTDEEKAKEEEKHSGGSNNKKIIYGQQLQDQTTFLVLCYCRLSVAPVISFICIKAGEMNSQCFVLSNWTD